MRGPLAVPNSHLIYSLDSDIAPDASGTRDIGTVSTAWASGFIDEVYLDADPTQPLQAATKQYVDIKASSSGILGNESINALNDVDTATSVPSTNEVLKWNGVDWVPAAYDATFVFSISSFSDNQSTTQLIGTGTWKAIGAITFDAVYDNGPATAARVEISSNGGVTWAADLDYSTPYTTVNSSETTAYPGAKDQYVRFMLDADKAAENDTQYESSIYFRNNVHWGISTKDSGFSEADVEGLTGSVVSNDYTRSVAITPGANDYLVFAHPSSYTTIPYGSDYETDSTTGFLYDSIACAYSAPETVSITNSAGYTENYKVYASIEKNLGSHTLTTSTSAAQINPLYYGVTTKTDTFLEADIEGLANSSVTNDNTQTWNEVTAGVGEYLLFSFPVRLGVITFWVGGFEGGFESSETVSVTNANGWTEDYYVWRSTNNNLGATTVETQ